MKSGGLSGLERHLFIQTTLDIWMRLFLLPRKKWRFHGVIVSRKIFGCAFFFCQEKSGFHGVFMALLLSQFFLTCPTIFTSSNR